MKNFIVGNTAVLNSGGPVMTVAGTKTDRDNYGNTLSMCYAVWFCKKGEAQGQWFDNRCLREPVERDFA